MPKHFIIWSEGSDNIEIYIDEPVVVVKAQRSDLEDLKRLDEALRPGVYVLMNENRRYIGQASGSVYSRIKSHDKNKNWWSELVFFSREDGRLDKSQLDYLENKLIKEFINGGFDVDNGNGGNISHIEPYQKGRASQTLSKSLEILKNVAKIDIFKKVRESKSNLAKNINVVQGEQHTPTTHERISGSNVTVDTRNNTLKNNGKTLYTVMDDNGLEFKNLKLRQCYIEYVKALYRGEKREDLRELALNTNSTLVNGEGILTKTSKFYEKIDGDLYLLKNLSKEGIRGRLDYLSKNLGIEIIVTEES